MNFNHRRFMKELDLALVNRFLRLREHGPLSGTDYLPPTGFIVFMDAIPVCLGFLIKCDNGMAINSDLISDPTLPKEIRNAAVHELRRLLYKEAKESGLKCTTIFTKHEKLKERLKSLGYVEVDKGLTQMGRIL